MIGASSGRDKSDMSDNSVLESFGRNLTELAENNELDPVIGRDEEINRLSQILSRRKKNNPVLIGEPGVGKTAIAEGLAKKIVEGNASRVMDNYEIISLNLTSVIAGTKYRGQFEKRMKAVIKELEERKNVIILLDEIHTIVGAGSASSKLDAANILKPALARGDIQCIGTTTLDEYRQSIEKDGALERRFQKLIVDPTTPEETIDVLKAIRSYYEDFHNVKYSDEVVEEIVRLSGRYITERYFPDKAIDVMDEVGSRVHIESVEQMAPAEIEELKQELKEIGKKKDIAVNQQQFEKAAKFRDRESEIENEIKEKKQKWQEKVKNEYADIMIENVNEVISMISGIPVSNIGKSERQKLLNLEDVLSERVVGQEMAVETISKAVRRARSGVSAPDRPSGVFLFVGPTGVGKSLLSETLAEQVYGSKENLIRLDMSEYSESYNTSRLVGSPPGYVGHGEGGQLTEKVRRKPYSVVLLDEIEKAHPDIFNTLLQVFEDGRLTDGSGRTVSFKNTIIIMTSNVGAKEISKSTDMIGFNQNETDNEVSYKEVKSIVDDQVSKKFNPEFLNRIDDLVVFEGLSKGDVIDIVDIEVQDLQDRLSERGVDLSLTNPAKELIADEGYSVEYGARAIQRTIRKLVEEPVSEILLEDGEPEGHISLKVRRDDGEIEVEKV